MVTVNSTPELYFRNKEEWRDWLAKHHDSYPAVYLTFYKVELKIPGMRWEDAVKVALCYGWIDGKVKSLGNGKRKQYFCPRNPKSAWSKLNKTYVKELIEKDLMHESGLKKVELAKQNGSWYSLDNVENGIIPKDLQSAFDKDKAAFKNYKRFSRTYQKRYLFWLNQAKRDETRKKRIQQIIELCAKNIKSR
jgi:uncharacterized protein YdeI (YjbR/CyaY-like superfamily)